MIAHWRLCQCCGQPAQQRQIATVKYGLLYPDLCDNCVTGVDLGVKPGDEVYAEIERRQLEFDKNYEVVTFTPVIRPRHPEKGPE